MLPRTFEWTVIIRLFICQISNDFWHPIQLYLCLIWEVYDIGDCYFTQNCVSFGLNPFNELYRHRCKWKLIRVTIEKPNILNIFCGMSHHTRCLHDIWMYDAQFTMRLYTLSFKVCFPIGKYQNHKHESSKW